MGLPRSLVMLVVQMYFFFLSDPLVQSATGSSRTPARALDALLQEYAYKALIRPKTGIPYDASAPSNFTGINLTAMRLRSGSFRRYGVDMYNEFEIPKGVVVQPYVERLVLVYQNLGNWSEEYYPSLPGFTYLTPILGLLAYNASNLSATDLPELEMRASRGPIHIRFSNVKSLPDVAKCVWFNLQGNASFSSVESGNVCSTIQHGHFSIVVESVAPSPAPVSLPPPEAETPIAPPPPSPGKEKNSRVWVVVGSVVGGIVLLVLLSLLIWWVHKLKQRSRMEQMERAAELGEPLHMAVVGDTKAPTATVTRTQPTLETEYVP